MKLFDWVLILIWQLYLNAYGRVQDFKTEFVPTSQLILIIHNLLNKGERELLLRQPASISDLMIGSGIMTSQSRVTYFSKKGNPTDPSFSHSFSSNPKPLAF